MSWRSPFADGPCRVKVVTDDETVVFDQTMEAGDSQMFMRNCLDYTVAVSADGAVSLDGMQYGGGGGVWEIRVFPHAALDAPMQVADITCDTSNQGINVQTVSVRGADNWEGDSTILALDGGTWTPDPCLVPDPSAGVKPALWALYAEANGV